MYSMNNFTLEALNTGIKYKVKHCINVEKVKFVDCNKLVMIGNSGVVEVVEIGNN